MKKIIYSILILGFIHLAYGIYVSQWLPEILPVKIGPQPQGSFYDYSGVLNVHTNKSTGSANFDEVVAEANTAGLDFIIITDLNDFSPSVEREGYVDKSLVFVGGEYNYLDARILNFNMNSTEHLQGMGRSQVVFASLLSHPDPVRAEGIFVLAHPLKPGYKLNGEYPPGLDGIEIINLKSLWQTTLRDSKLSFLMTLFIYPFNPELSFIRMLSAAFDKEIALWDKLNQKQKIFGFAGADAEAKIRLPNDNFWRFPSYSTIFSIIRNHVLLKSELTGNSLQDRKKISDALRLGQFYLSIDILQNPTGFESYVAGGKDQIFPLGSELKLTNELNLVVKLPSKPELPFETIVYKDGEKIMTSTSPTTTFSIHSPGVYRSLVRVKVPLPLPGGTKWISWILTNPVFVR